MLEYRIRRFNRLIAITVVALLVFGVSAAIAVGNITAITVFPDSAIFDSNNVVGVAGDFAPGFAVGSFASNGVAKTDMYFSPEYLFGRPVTLGEIALISYWTKKDSAHLVDPRDWYVTLYTKPFPGDASSASWYGSRIGSEPYFSATLNAPASDWNQWTTEPGANQLRFFESTAGAPGANFGSYSDPHWDAFLAGNSLGTSTPYTTQEVLYLSLQTGSAWATGFTGQLDGLTVELTDGSLATVNFDVQLTKADCKKGGWQQYGFKNQGQCIKFVNTGK